VSYSKYFFIAKIEILSAFAYYINILSSSVFITFLLFIFYNLWKAVYLASAVTSISGFTLVGLLWYLTLSESIWNSGSGRTAVIKISDDVKSGNIAYYLNKPYNFVVYHFSSTTGTAIIRSVITFAFAGTLIYFLVGPLKITLFEIPFVLLSVLLAIILAISMNFLIGVTAFWIEDISAFRWIQDKLIFVLGGMLIPLSFFPLFLQKIALVLPFSYVAYAPAYMFVNFSVSFFVETVLIQILWITLFVAGASLLYNLGAKRVSINGG
jgi:ABC-2 type transport system permease protein